MILLAVMAQAPVPGPYKVIRDDINVEKKIWSIYCDTKDSSVQRTKGRKLEVQVAGSDWRVRGAGRRFGTKTCEGRNKTLVPTGSSADGKSVTLTCKSKRVTLGTEESKQTVSFTADTVTMNTTAKLHFKDRGDDCISIMTRKTVARRIPTEKEKPTDAKPCANPGPMEKLSISPRSTTVIAGGRRACFKAAGLDAEGCEIQTGVRWSVKPKTAGSVDDEGCFRARAFEHISASEEDASGEDSAKEGIMVTVSARAGNKVKSARVRVKPPRDGDEEDSAEEEGDEEVALEVTYGDFVITPLAGVLTKFGPVKSHANARKLVWLGLFGLMLLLATAVWFFVRRGRRTGDAVGTICPTCSAKYPLGSHFCGKDGSPLLPDYGGEGDNGSAD